MNEYQETVITECAPDPIRLSEVIVTQDQVPKQEVVHAYSPPKRIALRIPSAGDYITSALDSMGN